jgi:hypothetical protein
VRLVTAGADGTVRDGDDLLAFIDDGNPLDDGWRLPASDAPIIVAWSGTLHAELFAREPRNWMGAGGTQFAGRCDVLAEELAAANRTLAWRPHARHVLSDHPSVLAFMKTRGAPFGLALDPAALFEPSMLDTAEDHLERIMAALGPRASVVLLGDVDVDVDGETCTAVPLGRGRLPREVMLGLLERFVREGTPVVGGGGADTGAGMDTRPDIRRS